MVDYESEVNIDLFKKKKLIFSRLLIFIIKKKQHNVKI